MNKAASAIALLLRTSLKLNVVPLLILFALTMITYSEVATHSFLINWDDQFYITQNRVIRGFSLDNIKTAFTNNFVGNYAPVQIISYMLDYTLWGKNPTGYHAANILYHFLSGVLLYFLMLRLGCLKWSSALGAAIFLLHPVQVESVAWLSQRKNLLAMLMYLAAFHAYLSYRESESGRTKWYAVSVFFFLIALLSKSVVVIFPLMLVLFDVLIPPVRRHIKDHLDKLPYFAIAAAFGLLAIITQSADFGGGRVAYPANALFVIPISMLPVLVSYLGLILLPLPASLCALYFPDWKGNIDGSVFAALLVAVILVTVGWYCYRKDRTTFFWYALFFIGLLPVAQFIPLVTMMNERYLYFPMLGVAGLVGYCSGRLWERVRLIPFGARALLAASISLIIALSIASQLRGRVWFDSISLFNDAVAKHPNQTKSWSLLAEGYFAAGNLAIAQSYYEKAAGFGSLDPIDRRILAKIYLITGEYDKAYQQIWWLLLNGDKSKKDLELLDEYRLRIGSYQPFQKKTQQYPGE